VFLTSFHVQAHTVEGGDLVVCDPELRERERAGLLLEVVPRSPLVAGLLEELLLKSLDKLLPPCGGGLSGAQIGCERRPPGRGRRAAWRGRGARALVLLSNPSYTAGVCNDPCKDTLAFLSRSDERLRGG
jgi:hypothetical protein